MTSLDFGNRYLIVNISVADPDDPWIRNG